MKLQGCQKLWKELLQTNVLDPNHQPELVVNKQSVIGHTSHLKIYGYQMVLNTKKENILSNKYNTGLRPEYHDGISFKFC
jgi:hypothetical protein